MIPEIRAAELVERSLGTRPLRCLRQTLSQSGNDVFRAEMPGGGALVLRASPGAETFAATGNNLEILRGLGLPVQRVVAGGPLEPAGSFILLDWMPGRDLQFELKDMGQEAMADLAATVVDHQRRVGTLPLGQGYGSAPIGRKGPCDAWTRLFGPPVDPEAAAASTHPMDRIRCRLHPLRRDLEPYFAGIRPVCHLDEATLRNVLVEGGRLRGYIDLDFVGYGDPLLAVGTTLAAIEADVGPAGRFYGDRLLEAWNPTPEGRAAVRFYAALWAVGLLSQAVEANDAQAVGHLAPIAKDLLRSAETAA
jgi:aminoglycoside phosphotransferase